MLLCGKLTKDRKVPLRIVIVHLQVAMQTLIIVQIADMPMSLFVFSITPT